MISLLTKPISFQEYCQYSDDTARRYKCSGYAANEIPEYWIVDPDQGGVTILIFNQGLYDEIYLTGNQPLQSPQFPDLGITVQQLFDFSDTV